jgi:hypothetical protein
MPKSAPTNVGVRIRRRKQAISKRTALRRGRAATLSARDAAPNESQIRKGRFEAVMKAAKRAGLLSRKSGRIAGRVSPALLKQAKKQTGIEGDTDLIAFALASVALDDNFSDAFKKSRGKIPADLKLGS